VLHRERIETPDGDFLDLDFAGWPPTAPGRTDAPPLVLVLHGLEGTTRRRYMTSTYRALLAAGHAAGRAQLPRLQRRAEPDAPGLPLGRDRKTCAFMLEILRDRFGGPLGLVGYSLGGNVVLKFLGEHGGGWGPDLVGAAVAVSVPFDLAAGAERLERGLPADSTATTS
jgi:uncharacterized protein